MKLSTIFLLTFFAFCNTLFSSHKMGADMHYIHLGGLKYKVITKFYRECRGIPFNSPTLTLKIGSNNLSTECGTFTLSYDRTSIKDVTQICSDSSLPCNPLNTMVNRNGVEEHIFEFDIDFNNGTYSSILNSTNCTEATFFFEQCCRNGSITTISPDNFLISSTIYLNNINKTSKKLNNSVKFANLPIIYACCNIPFSVSQGGIDKLDGDSISFSLVPVLNTIPNGSSNYISPFTYNYPMTPYCPPNPGVINCNPLPNANPPRGFYFDNKTGDIIFTPMNCAEVGVIAVEANEFRKDSTGTFVQVGRTRRDMQLIINNCGNNIAPKFTGNNTFSICEGQKLCFNVNVNESDTSSKDSIILSWNTDYDNLVVKMLDSSSHNKMIEVCFNTIKGEARNTPYVFSLTANDNACPYPIKVSKTYLIKVINCNNVSQLYRQNNSFIKLYPNPANSNLSVKINDVSCKLLIYDINGKVVLQLDNYQNQENINIDFLSKGNYIVKCFFNGFELSENLIVE